MRVLILTLAALPFAGTALASSEDAWAAFRTDVEAKCRALVQTEGETEIEVNPFGSDKFGAAIVTTTTKQGTVDRSICIYDKQAKTAEMTAPFNAGS